MELSFITSALRRYYWVVIIFTVLGALPGLLRPTPSSEVYASDAVLLVAPSTEARGQGSSGDPDRYIVGQVSVLASEALAERVAAQVSGALDDEEYTADGVREAASFAHQPGSDIVTITVTTPRPDVSQTIGNAYVDQYFEALRAQIDEAQEPEIKTLTDQMTALRGQLADVDGQLAAVMQPYLPTGPVSEGDSAAPIPTAEQIAPELVSERSILLTQLESTAATLSQLETSARLRVGSEVVQRATLPDEAAPKPTNRLLIAGAVGGAFMGVLAAVVLARLSPRVLDDSQATDILGQPIVGVLPASRTLVRDRRSMVEHVPANVVPFVNALCVHAEVDHGTGSLAVTVVGTRGGAGATTLAGCIANRFAQTGSSVLLVDADPQHQELTKLFPVVRGVDIDETGGIAGLIDARKLPPDLVHVTLAANLSICRAGDDTLRRPQHMTELFGALAAIADVVVYDAGSLMASASTVQLARLSDSVVVAIPRRQTIRGLNAVVRTLRRRDFLPVWTPVPKRRRATGRRLGGPAKPESDVLPDELLVPSP